MLVLTRTLGEEIIIAGNVRVRVAEVKGGRVKLAIDAPKEVAIRRSEIGVTPAPAAEVLAAAR